MIFDIVDRLKEASLRDDDPWDGTLYIDAVKEIERLRSLLLYSDQKTQLMPVYSNHIKIYGEDGKEYTLEKENDR